jgi:hypothetical protein
VTTPPVFVAVTAQDKYFPEFCSRNVLLKVYEGPVPTLVAFASVLFEFTYHSTTSELMELDQAQPEQVAIVPIGMETLDEIPPITGYLPTVGLAKDGTRLPRLVAVAVPPSPDAELMQ